MKVAILAWTPIACSTPGDSVGNIDAAVRTVVRVDSYGMNGMMFSPDEIIPSMTVTIESLERYAGRCIEIGLIPVGPSDRHLFDQIEELVGERVSLDLPEPMKANEYLFPPESLNIRKETGAGNVG